VIPRPFALLIDATTLLYRGYFARRSLIARDGSQVNAVYGFMEALLALLAAHQPEYAAAAFDDPETPSFRTALYPDYKRNRPPVPERLKPQFAMATAAARALGVAAAQTPGFEADDLLATLVRRMRGHDIACLVVGADKDLAQLVGPGVWLVPPEQGTPMDAAAVRVRYGVPPERIPDWLALRGDPIDNLPGVPGIGDRTARRLLDAEEPVEAFWNDPRALEQRVDRDTARVAAALRDGRGAFRIGRELATLSADAPLELPDRALAYHGPDPDTVRAFCDRLGFDQLRDRILGFAVSFGTDTETRRHEDTEEGDADEE
jgi:5'-3' exonuclease